MSIPKHHLSKLSIKSPLLKDTLAHLADPPKQLFCRGNKNLLQGSVLVAVVGSRRVTPYGQKVTHKLAYELAKQGIVVVSGLALGVDSLAHAAALEAKGQTIAVLPGSLEKVYPASHSRLAERIVEQGGLLLTEYAEASPPMKHQFIARNRLISGLSNAVVITEAARKSGSLHTASFALDQGKQVLAVPGNIDNPNSVGANNLIKVGAAPVTGVNDIFQALGLDGQQLKLAVTADTNEEAIILRLLAAGHSQTEQLLARSKLSASIFNQTLTMLEITGKVRSLGAGHWALT